ncbi:MAG TPA: iron uptake transporter deferrochelatase/peroxidase subunit [Micromonosporaceae bacterium]|jgi:deferrochelatase/peroxidase EfeB
MTDRRAFLRGAVGASVAGVAGAAAGAGITAAVVGGSPAAAASTASGPLAHVPFHGARQAGITTGPQAHATMLGLDVEVANRAELEDLLRTITERARFLTTGGTPPDPGISAPPTDSGVLGPVVVPDRLSVTLGVGASLFDGRFGLAERRPAELVAMPTFPDDHLVPELTHGDLSLQVCAENCDTVGHAIRDIAKATRGAFAVRWRVDGFRSPPRPAGTPRNLLGFKDGTANLDARDAGLMSSRVWLGGGTDQPWTAGGTFQVVRTIRMLIEFWDRIGINEQENLIGRRRDSGAPMDGNAEIDRPNYAQDPVGAATPLTSHIRLANPRTPQTEANRILRRPYNYDNGMDAVGNLDMGLLFVCYQQSIAKQFATVQKRLAGEPLVDYIEPVGGGYFLALPGVRDERDFFGSAMLA